MTGIDKQRVGQVAAEIRALREPEPYKGKGMKYVANSSSARKARRSEDGVTMTKQATNPRSPHGAYPPFGKGGGKWTREAFGPPLLEADLRAAHR